MSRNVTKKTGKINIQNPTNSWVFVIKKDILNNREGTLEETTPTHTPDIVRLRHPNTDEPALFLFSADNTSIQEVLTFTDGKRSWFIGQLVKSDGKMYLSTPVDPIFLVLPYLYKSKQTQPLEQLLQDQEFPANHRLLKAKGLKYMDSVADKISNPELIVYRYNEEKTLIWLKKKAERIAKILRQKKIHVTGGAVSATYVKVETEIADEEQYMRYAVGIVCDYLPIDLGEKLFKFCNFTEELPATSILKRKILSSSNQDLRDVKKAKTESISPVSETCTPPIKMPKESPTLGKKEKARAKAAKGSSSITSFFTKK